MNLSDDLIRYRWRLCFSNQAFTSSPTHQRTTLRSKPSCTHQYESRFRLFILVEFANKIYIVILDAKHFETMLTAHDQWLHWPKTQTTKGQLFRKRTVNYVFEFLSFLRMASIFHRCLGFASSHLSGNNCFSSFSSGPAASRTRISRKYAHDSTPFDL